MTLFSFSRQSAKVLHIWLTITSSNKFEHKKEDFFRYSEFHFSIEKY